MTKDSIRPEFCRPAKADAPRSSPEMGMATDSWLPLPVLGTFFTTVIYPRCQVSSSCCKLARVYRLRTGYVVCRRHGLAGHGTACTVGSNRCLLPNFYRGTYRASWPQSLLVWCYRSPRYDIMKWLSGSNASAITCMHAGSRVFLTLLVEVRRRTGRHSTAQTKLRAGSQSSSVKFWVLRLRLWRA
jgi:hypothetical protein